MKKVSFVGVIHFLSAVAVTLNEQLEWILKPVEGAQMAFKSLKNYGLQGSSTLYAEDVRNPEKNPFTVAIGRIAALIHANPQLKALIGSTTFPGGSTAERMFNLYFQIDLGGTVIPFDLQYIKLGKDSMQTFHNILQTLVDSVAGEENPGEQTVERTEEQAQMLALILQAFKVTKDEALHQRTSGIKSAVELSVKTVSNSAKLYARLKALENGTHALAEKNKEMKERIGLLENPAAIRGKQMVTEKAEA